MLQLLTNAFGHSSAMGGKCDADSDKDEGRAYFALPKMFSINL